MFSCIFDIKRSNCQTELFERYAVATLKNQFLFPGFRQIHIEICIHGNTLSPGSKQDCFSHSLIVIKECFYGNKFIKTAVAYLIIKMWLSTIFVMLFQYEGPLENFFKCK